MLILSFFPERISKYTWYETSIYTSIEKFTHVDLKITEFHKKLVLGTASSVM